MGLDQGSDCEQEGVIGELSGLQEDLLARLDVVERFLPRARETLDLARSTEHDGERELVAVLDRLPPKLLVSGERSLQIVGLGEHEGEIAARAHDDRDALHPRLERASTLQESHLESVAE